jgi:hypothetical protein
VVHQVREEVPRLVPPDLPAGAPAAPAGASAHRTTTTFPEVRVIAGRRVAYLEQRVEPNANAEMKVNGTGTIDVNLDRRFIGSSNAQWAFSGTAFAAAGALPSAHSAMRGTIKITVTAAD